MKTQWLVLMICGALLGAAGCVTQGDNVPLQSAADIPVPNPKDTEPPAAVPCDELAAIAASPTDFVIIDARSPSEFDDGHVPTAVNVPFDSVAGYADALPADRTSAIVTYCRSGRRANVLKSILGQLGYTNVTAVPGEQMVTAGGALNFGCQP